MRDVRFSSQTQRRNPCSRMEPFEEYVVAWRKGRVEFYQEWVSPPVRRGSISLIVLSPTPSGLA